MDRLHLDLVFIQETWQELPQRSAGIDSQLISRAGYMLMEYSNSNQRRGIQFTVAAHLEPFLLKEQSNHQPSVEILTIPVCGVVFTEAYIPDGPHSGRHLAMDNHHGQNAKDFPERASPSS